MVSFWPWRGEDTSPASFEKTLSALTSKITKLQIQQDILHQRHRRYKALWTLYTSFAYLLCFVIAFLVVGWKNMTGIEYTALAGAPITIYLVRNLISTYYLQRLNTVSSRLNEQLSFRNRTIEKLKAATMYDSTQTLLEKYGGSPPSTPKGDSPAVKAKKGSGPRKQKSSTALGRRTGVGPPPTANIPQSQTATEGEQVASPRSSTSPIFPTQEMTSSPRSARNTISLHPVDSNADFAPNAFSSKPQYASAPEIGGREGHWYDRILDLLLGEDETSARNRMALICVHCRLVNGLAPPGTKNPRALGRWRCAGCREWNGEDENDAGKKILETLKDRMESGGQERETEEMVEKKPDSANEAIQGADQARGG